MKSWGGVLRQLESLPRFPDPFASSAMRTHVIPRFIAILAVIVALTPQRASSQASQTARVKALVGGTLIDGYGRNAAQK